MDGITPHNASQPYQTDDAVQMSHGSRVDASLAHFEAIKFADTCHKGHSESISHSMASLTSDDAETYDFSWFFTLTKEKAKYSTAALTDALHEALSSPLHANMTATTQLFDIATKKQKLMFIKDHLLVEAYRAQAISVINNYINKLVEHRDNALMDKVLLIADSAQSFADMLDQFEMIIRNQGGTSFELQSISQLADHWEDFVQRYA